MLYFEKYILMNLKATQFDKVSYFYGLLMYKTDSSGLYYFAVERSAVASDLFSLLCTSFLCISKYQCQSGVKQLNWLIHLWDKE